ncbi:cilia- and flagella-associated protein 61-like [Leguminivora glycinivorella]|uniref:cilia- and flagella-associated protein 61-like n=1 Tax=Leguminivora glycinivorella TaxID=1035111 RepID=UPI00200F5C46|nr:cilia- and flagella-associated protein 61-like [Leguminivora glycinivorella]
MSIFFDFHVEPGGKKFRRAIDLDKHEINLFMDKEHTKAIFGDVDIGALIELATLSICLINDQMKLIGFMALNDHPNVPGVPAADWEYWLKNMFQRNLLPHNTLFLHMMCCAEFANDFFLDEAFASVFSNDEYLRHIVLIPPPTCTFDILSRYRPFRKHIIKRIPSKREDDDAGFYMYLAHRDEFYPDLSVRVAVEEDNDDVVEILDKLHPSMKKLYGDFYVSEIIGRHPESPRKIVVAQQDDEAVGLMCLNAQIDYQTLSKTYDLTPYFGLRKVTGQEKEELWKANSSFFAFGEPILLGKRNPFDSVADLIDINEIPRKTSTHTPRKTSSHVFFKKNAAMRRSMDQLFFNKHSDDFSDKVYIPSRSPSLFTNASLRPSVVLDEDPFDYDIVNIDSSLLAVPDVPIPLRKISSSLWLKEQNSHEKIKRFKTRKRSTVISSKRLKKQRKLLLTAMQANTSETVESEYRGEPNAFSIELYALRDDIDERKGYDLLQAAFELMKDYEYCLLRMPCTSSSMFLLRHFCFVPCKDKLCSDYALYIAHRSSVLGKLTVRKAEMVDVPQISRLMNHLDGKEAMWLVENSIMGKQRHEAFVFVCGLDIIGFAVLEPPEQIDFLQARYDMDAFRIPKYHHSGQGPHVGFVNIKTALVYPVFEVHFRFFFREIMRLSGADTLIWFTGYRNKWVIHKANSMALSMVPLKPRQWDPVFSLVPELKKIGKMAKKVMAFSSWFLSKKLTSVTRLNVDTRIIVVGASRTAVGFLSKLLFSDASSYLTFTSVTLVSTDGLPYVRHPDPCAEMMFPHHRTTTQNYLQSTPYTYYANVVQGTLVEINKEDKYIIIASGQRYYYDKLFLMLGQQFQHPDYLKAVLDRERDIRHGMTPSYTRLDVPSLREPQIETNYDTPPNVFIINTIADANKVVRQVRNLTVHYNEKIIVYGSSLEVYCCLAALKEMNISSKRIVFVEPFPSEDLRQTRVPIFNNVYVDQTISEVLDELGIKVLRSYYFQYWKTDDRNVVTHVSFLSHFHMVELECAALFYYGTQGLDADAFQAIHKSGIVYSEGILIDHECRTNDHSIYAAGPATRYSSRYFAEMRNHQYYDSFEVGVKLGIQIRNQLDPLFSQNTPNSRKSMQTSVKSVSFDSTIYPTTARTFAETGESFYSYKSTIKRDSKHQPDNDLDGLPVYKNPHSKYCIMPGGLQYLEVRTPGMKIPHPYVQSLDHNGFVMETFKTGYFKLHMTPNFIVDGITCLTPAKYSIAHFKALFGKPATILNNVHIKYTTKKVKNLYEFFISPGIMFLYHDHIDELFAVVKEILPLDKPNGETLSEALTEANDKYKRTAAIRSKFEKSPHVEAIAAYVLEWVSQNDLLLPMYYQPWQLPDFQHDSGLHPAFVEKKVTSRFCQE